MRDGDCKGCSADVRVPRSQIDRLLGSMAGKGFGLVDDYTYAGRLAACRACPALEYDTTCMHCGCLVEIRAKLGNKDCPHPGGSRWKVNKLNFRVGAR